MKKIQNYQIPTNKIPYVSKEDVWMCGVVSCLYCDKYYYGIDAPFCSYKCFGKFKKGGN